MVHGGTAGLVPMLAGRHKKAASKQCRNKNAIHSWNQYADLGCLCPSEPVRIVYKGKPQHAHQAAVTAALCRPYTSAICTRTYQKRHCLQTFSLSTQSVPPDDLSARQEAGKAATATPNVSSAQHQMMASMEVRKDGREAPSRQPGTRAMGELLRWPATIPRPPTSRSSLATVSGTAMAGGPESRRGWNIWPGSATACGASCASSAVFAFVSAAALPLHASCPQYLP